MERRGGVCIARYGGDADAAWRLGRIMLRFRPIAPKPASLATPAATPAAPVPLTGGTRSKRKATATNSTRRESKRGRKPKKAAGEREDATNKSSSSPSSSSSAATSMDSSSPPTLLPLLPESPDRPPKQTALPPPPPPRVGEAAPAVVVPTPPVQDAASWVTVEGVTGAWQDGEIAAVPSGVACDDAPAFVSDQWGRVTWTNAAFQKMVVGKEEEEEEEEEVRVGLVTRGAVPAWGTCAGFTCRVRVLYACKRRGRGSLAAPCDVWRLDGGAYVWRLDIKAALSLGLGVSLN